MDKVIKISTEIKSFVTKQGVVCSPMIVEDYWILPLGWEEELKAKKVEFEYIDYQPKEILENEE